VEEQKPKWGTFTYIEEETRRIAKLFKNSNIQIAFRTNNKMEMNLRTRKQN
jgi:hypothetical protein